MEKSHNLYHLRYKLTDLNSMNMFLGYNWLVKHNPEVNWNLGTI